MPYMVQYTQIKKLVESASKIVITSHKSPDGDSIGSSVALYLTLKALGKDVTICHPDPFPNYLAWVPCVNEIVDFESKENEGATFYVSLPASGMKEKTGTTTLTRVKYYEGES